MGPAIVFDLLDWFGGASQASKAGRQLVMAAGAPHQQTNPFLYLFLKDKWRIKKEERVVFVGELAIQLITFHPVIKEKFTFLYGGGSSSFHQKQPFLPSTKKEKVLF